MDIYDRASDAALALQGAAPAPTITRDLAPHELDRLISHLVTTEMPIPAALNALRLGLPQLTIDDLERLEKEIARCRHCSTWTRLNALEYQVCPDCRDEAQEGF